MTQPARAPVPIRPAAVYLRTLKITTQQDLEFVDISDDVRELVRDLDVRDGMAVVFSRHTTAAIKINEREPLLLDDMARVLRQWAPPGNGYSHDDFSVRTVNMTPDERPNGHAHCQQLLLNTSETIPISDGELLLGAWQSLFVVELDGPRERDILVQVWASWT
jgi:secondary thiamine-phosphate synthase enzyme